MTDEQKAQRIYVRDMVARFPVHLDTSADLEHCIAAILDYGTERFAAGRRAGRLRAGRLEGTWPNMRLVFTDR